MKGFKDFTVGNTALDVVSSHWGKIESHAVPVHGVICYSICLIDMPYIHSREADYGCLYRNKSLAVQDLQDRTSQKKTLKRTKKLDHLQQRISVL